MAVKVIKRAYNEIYTDQETDWLLGNVGDWQKAKITVEVGIEFFATSQSPVSINTLEKTFTLTNGKEWGQLGFDIGMTMTLSYSLEQDTNGDGVFNSVNEVQQDYEILNVLGSTIEVNRAIDVNDYENIPTNFGNRRITSVHFFVDQEPEGCRLFYGHLTNENYQSTNLNSVIDGSETQFIFPNFTGVVDGMFVPMEAVGLQSGMSIRKALVRKIGATQDDVLVEYNIPASSPLAIVVGDNVIINAIHDSIRSVRSIISGSAPNYNTVPSEDYIVQTNGDVVGGQPVTAAPNQFFLLNASSGYSQEVFLNLSVRLNDTQNLSTGDGAVFRLSLLRFTNGAALNFAERTVLRQWSNPNTLVNQVLNYNGLKQLNVDTGDSFMIAVEYFRPNSRNESSGISYSWVEGFMQLSQFNGTLNQGIRKIFEFEIEYMISSLFDSINNFQDNTLPSYLEGDGSLTDNFRFEFYPEWNNPNVIIKNVIEQTARLGNTGWFNENFNELTNDFEIESVRYLDNSGNPVDSLDYTSKTKVQITIAGVSNLNTITECGLGFSWVPIDESDYRNKETPFYRNVFVQSGNEQDGFKLNTLYPGPYIGAGIDGASMDSENIKFTNVAGKIIAEITFAPNVAFFNKFDSKDEGDRKFIIWVSVADGQLERNFSDRVSLLVDFGDMVKNLPPSGPYPFMKNKFIEHPFVEDNIGKDVYKGFSQDDVLCRVPFGIVKDNNEPVERITFGVEVFNSSENRSFELENYQIDITQFPTSGGVQQIDLDTIRGFKLNSGNNKNWVKIERNTDGDTSGENGYIGYYAFKIRYEDWIQNQDSPNDFFDSLQDNDGFHNDWINYLRTTGWIINMFVETVTLKDGELIEYRNQFPFEFNDYDENIRISTDHNYYRNSDDTLINIGTDSETGKPLGIILSSEETRIEIDYNIIDSGLWDIINTYATITIEIDKGAGYLDMRQISSVWIPESDNPLKPVSGQTKLKIEVDSINKQLKTICLIDPELLDEAVRYRITGRVGCFADGGERRRLYERRYEKFTNNNNT